MEIGIIQKRLSEMPRTDQNQIVYVVNSQDPADLLIEEFYVIPISLLSKSAKVIEILSNLRCGYLHHITQFLRRNPLYSSVLQFSQEAVITWESADHRL